MAIMAENKWFSKKYNAQFLWIVPTSLNHFQKNTKMIANIGEQI